MNHIFKLTLLPFLLTATVCNASDKRAEGIVHDAEYTILEAQNGKAWAADDKTIDKKLADIRKKNGGKPPNIVYILLDDVGFGEIGMPDMAVTRGYKTPRISALAKEGLSLQRMYSEPSCTPTRVAMMTGRLPSRTGLDEAKATIAGEGLSGEEVLLAEVLRDAGYYTSHVGKWHMGDIEEAWANNQGFMNAEFPIHQQGQLALMHKDAEIAHVVRSVQPSGAAQTFTLDKNFVPDPSDMVTGVELRDGKLYEVDLKPGEKWDAQKYKEMNYRYQDHALEQLRTLAKQDKPFFLNYWPLWPIAFTRSDIDEFKTINGGTAVERIVLVDQWVGEIIDEVNKLGIAENTVIVVMGDNGPFMKLAGVMGQSDRVYRGGKTQHLEGGVRVNAYVSWKGVIEPGTYAEDIIHVSDLYTTFARLANATDQIPRDRIIDGLDQSGMMLLGETHGRRDYVFIYEGPNLKSVVKNKFKLHIPPPGSNAVVDGAFYDLTRDPREERKADSLNYGVWAGGQFANMIGRHMAMKKKYPNNPLKHGIPYTGIENLRPESIELVETFKASLPQK